MFDVNVVTEPESADQGWKDVRAQTGLVSDQLLQTSDGERVLGADIHRSCRETGSERSILSVQEAFRDSTERRSNCSPTHNHWTLTGKGGSEARV